MTIRWWQSLRTRIAATLIFSAVFVVTLVGLLVDQRATADFKDRLRAQANDRITNAAAAYALNGQLRFDASVSPSYPPQQLTQGLGVNKQVTLYDGRYMWAARRISEDVTISVKLSAAPVRTAQAELRQTLLLSGAVGTLGASALAWLLGTWLSRRLRLAATLAARMGPQDTERRLDMPGHDEVAALTRAVDAMAEPLAAGLRAEQAFSADVAHELRTPITALVSAAELLPPGPEADLVRRQVDRMRRLVIDLLEVFRLERSDEALEMESVDLGVLVGRMLADRAEDVQITCVESERVLVEARRLERVLDNVVINAVRHGGSVPAVMVEERSLTVTDDGPGYPAELLQDGPARFRALGPTKGSGLGMTIVMRQLAVMGASAALANVPGAQITMEFQPAKE